MKTIPKLGSLSINITLNGWPCAIVCIAGIVVIGGGGIYLGSKLIKNGYQLKNPKGISLTKGDDKDVQQPELPDKRIENKTIRSGSDPKNALDTSASDYFCTIETMNIPGESKCTLFRTGFW
jgi:hypothetical protein